MKSNDLQLHPYSDLNEPNQLGFHRDPLNMSSITKDITDNVDISDEPILQSNAFFPDAKRQTKNKKKTKFKKFLKKNKTIIIIIIVLLIILISLSYMYTDRKNLTQLYSRNLTKLKQKMQQIPGIWKKKQIEQQQQQLSNDELNDLQKDKAVLLEKLDSLKQNVEVLHSDKQELEN
jgi:hypothetical protein